MKKVFFTAFAAALALVACNRNEDVQVAGSGKIRIEAHVVSPGTGTRATGVTAQSGRNDSVDESAINSLQVFVFNGEAVDGVSPYVEKSNVAVVPCTGGQREVYAVVNCPNLSGSVTSRTSLLQQVATLGSSASAFQMLGSTSAMLTDGSNVEINVKRHAARVVIRKIRNSLNNEALASQFRILAVYLTNVAGDVDFGHSSNYSIENWYNRRGYESNNNLGAVTYDAVNAAVAYGEANTYSTAHYFYSMPNAYPGAVGGVFTPRAARLVVKVQIGENVYDYPILFPALESNKSY